MEDALVTNRELAALVLLAGPVAFVLAKPGRSKVLRSVAEMLLLLSKPRTLIPLSLYVGWVFAATAAAARIGLWNFGLLKPTILWLVLSGLALVIRLDDAIKKPGFFRGAVMSTLGVVAAVEFLSALKSFPLWIEIPAQALAFIFAGLAVIAAKDPKNAPVRKLATGYLVIFGLSALVWSAAHLVAGWASLNKVPIVRELLLPIWLTPIALVFVYGFAVIAAYESSFKLMGLGQDAESLAKQKLAMVLRANGRLGTLRLLTGFRAQRIARTRSFRDAWKEIGSLRDEERQRAAQEIAANRRLIANAGVTGTDDSGRQLDQREFAETRQALRWLAVCHTGHYRNSDHSYRPDLLPIVESHFERDGLPADHGVEMRVSADGKSWYAIRQTITGWWFAIGAAGPPPDEWLYDGPAPPEGFPGEQGWDRFGGGKASVNWG